MPSLARLSKNGAPGVLVWQRSLLYVIAIMDDASEATVGAVLASFDASIRPSRLVVRQAADMVGGSHLGLRVWSYISVGSIDSCEVFSPPAAQSERTITTRPMLTGIAAIDALTPIGCGQSVLIAGAPHRARCAATSR